MYMGQVIITNNQIPLKGGILVYLLAGQKSDTQKILNEYFPPDKASEYMLAIQQDFQGLDAQHS
jgi:hypothetical protein